MDEMAAAEVLTQLALALKETHAGESTADLATLLATECIPDADWASLTVTTKGHRHVTLASTHTVAREADELQYALGEGPCVEVSHRAEWYRSGDVAVDRRWSRWGPKAHDLGVGSLVSVQLSISEQPVGALNLYAAATGRFSDREEVDFAVLVGAHVAIALTSASEASGLHTALNSRHVIGVAQGILIERYGLDLDTSFSLLRRYSSTLNTKLADVARDIVKTGRLPDELPQNRVPTTRRDAPVGATSATGGSEER